MAKQQFRNTRFRHDSQVKIEKMVEIIEEYQKQGLRMTARQLYYQFVSRDLILNSQKEYKKLTSLLTDARYAGLVDWNAIEDRGREPSIPPEWENLKALTESALRAYRLPRWGTQKTYVELWVEKQALAGVLAPLAREYHVTLMVNKGYSSASAMKESAERIRTATITDENRLDDLVEDLARAKDEGDEPTMNELLAEFKEIVPRDAFVLYLGDHDPSGEDMVRDIEVRLKEFGVFRLTVTKIALTMGQVRQYNPPPNPAKITDPRAKDYVEKYGESSWEVDALSPAVLSRLIRSAFDKVIDKGAMDKIKKREETDKEFLRKAVSGIQ